MEIGQYSKERDHRKDGRALVFRLNDHGQGPEIVRQVFLERGWMEYDEEEEAENDWNIYWRTSRFRTGDYDHIKPWQRLNHYPKSTTITKKDCLARNLKRMKGVHGAGVYNFSPAAFNLPNDYTRFVSEYTRLRQSEDPRSLLWICKPADLSRGRGIFLFRELSDLQYDCNAVVQRYIANPLLIGGYKFDLRIYVVVPCFHPLNVYIYQEGLVRFSTEKFCLDSLSNIFSHLTNTSINKHSPAYTTDKERVGPGCKWTITQLRYYFHQNNIDDRMLFARISNIIVLTMIMQAPQVTKTSNCFELYGFDIIIDENLKPWLLEVNFSPALNMDCQADVVVKKPMLHDLMDMVNFKESDKERGGGGDHGCKRSNLTNSHISTVSTSRSGQPKLSAVKTINPLFSKTRGSALSLGSQKYLSYHYEQEEDTEKMLLGGSCLSERTAGRGLPIIEDREDIKRPMSESSGFSSASSHGSGQRQPGIRSVSHCRVRSAKLAHSSKRRKADLNIRSPQSSSTSQHQLDTHSEQILSLKPALVGQKYTSISSVTSDSGCNSESSDHEVKSSTPHGNKSRESDDFSNPINGPPLSHRAMDKVKSFSKTAKPPLKAIKSLQPSASSPALNKLPSHRSSPRNKLGVKYCSQENLNELSSRSGSVNQQRPRLVQRSHSQIKLTAESMLVKTPCTKSFRNPTESVTTSIVSAKSPSVKVPVQTRPAFGNKKELPITGSPQQVGDYYLVFPVNDAMLKASQPALDVRLAVLESQKVLKRSLIEIRTGSVQKAVTTGTEVLDSLWGPIRLPEGET